MSAENLTLAIDGGGSKTTACVAGIDSGTVRVFSEATTGPSNPMVMPLETVKQNLASAANQAIETSGSTSAEVATAIIGLAGLRSAGVESTLAAWAGKTFSARIVELMSDIELLARGTLESLPGILLISGTGSIAVAMRTGEILHRCGGRGYLLGDEGSGYWIGAEGIRRAIQASDGLGEATSLVDAAATYFGRPDPTAWSREVYASPDPRTLLASAARWVDRCAQEDDVVAQDILNSAGQHLAQLVVVSKRHIETEFDLVLAGGVLVGMPAVRESMQASLQTSGIRPNRLVTCTSAARMAAKRMCASLAD